MNSQLQELEALVGFKIGKAVESQLFKMLKDSC